MRKTDQAQGLGKRIAQSLRQRIHDGQWSAGDRLPTVRELARMHDVSLDTVRTALMELQGQGLVECRPRQGVYVKVAAQQAPAEPPVQVKQVLMLVSNMAHWMDYHCDGMPAWDSWGHQVADAFEMSLFDQGYSLMTLAGRADVCQADGRPTLEQKIDRMGEALHGVILFAHTQITPAVVDLLESRRLPWVCVNQPHRSMSYNYVSADNLLAGWKAGRLFDAAGLDRVLLLTLPHAKGSVTPSEKATGFIQAWMECDRSMDDLRVVYCDEFFAIDAKRSVAEALRDGFRPRGVFAVGDLMALGAVEALQEAGYRVPEDVSVVGATGSELSGQSPVPLSAVVQPTVEMGLAAARMLIRRMHDPGVAQPPVRLATPLVLRDSLLLTEQALAKLACQPDTRALHAEILRSGFCAR